MKTRNKKYGFKKFLVGGMLALSVFSTSFLVTNFEKSNLNSVYANYQTVQDTLSNSDFSSYSTSGNPYTPNNWNFNNPTGNESIKHGIIDVSSTSFADKKKDYELSENPGFPAGNPTQGDSDPLYKHLMINSNSGFGRAGYTSGTFSLEANSYYSVTVSLKTTTQAQAAIYISGLSDDKIKPEIVNISTFNNWETYTIFIETNQFTSENASLELWLGSKEHNDTYKGAAFFNKVTLTKYSKTTFDKNIANSDPTTTKVVSLYTPTYQNLINNANFDANHIPGDKNAINQWETVESSQDEKQMLKVVTTNNYNAAIDTEEGIANPGTNFISTDNSVLFMYNKESGSQGIKSNEFTIEQNELYMVSVWAKSNCSTGTGATLVIEQVNENEDDEDEEFTPVKATLQTATSIGSNPSTNNWTQYKFFVEGHPLQNTKATLQIWLGTKEEKTNGYVFVDDITIQKVSYATKESGAQTDHSTTYSYNTNNTQFTIVNGNFNIAKKPENTLTYPLEVSNWTLNKDDNYDDEQNLTGVINTNSVHFAKVEDTIEDKELAITIANPGLTPIQRINGATLDNSNNNVLMIGNTIETSQNFVSDKFNLTASNYYKISALVNTQFSSLNENAGVQIKLANNSFTAVNVENINTYGEWQKVNFYVHVGATNTEFSLTLALNNTQGFAFFDDISVFESSEAEFNAVKQNNEYKAELNTDSVDGFDLHDQIKDNYPLADLYNWTATNHAETQNVVYGVLDTSKNTKNVFVGIDNPQAVSGNSVLAINSNIDTHFTLSASNQIDLSMDGYYKITVRVKTVNISQEKNNYDEDGNLINYGATIALNGYDKSFTGINTQKDEIDGYATYTFLIKPTADAQTYVTLGLGSENNYVSGYAFFDDVTVAKIEEAVYNEEVSKANIRTILLGDQKTEKEPEETGTEFTGSQFDWVLVPSLLTSLAIIIAIAGSTIRRFKFTKHPKIKTKYDRRKTVEVDLSKKERIELRNEIIKELNGEYNEIEDEIKNLIAELDAEKARAELIKEEKLKAYEQIKQTILLEREKATREYNDKLNSSETLTEQDKAKYEKEFKAYIAKLDKKSAAEAKKINRKDNTIALLEAKHAERVKALNARKQYIADEIARIEKEIEEIAKQEEIMWNEYRKAKEEAKKQKLEYLAEKRKEKEIAKANKKSAKQEQQVENKPESAEKVETVETEETKTEETTEVEIVEPDNKNE